MQLSVLKMYNKNWIWSCCYGFCLVVVSLLLVFSETCRAQDTSCVTELVPCLNYLNHGTGTSTSTIRGGQDNNNNNNNNNNGYSNNNNNNGYENNNGYSNSNNNNNNGNENNNNGYNNNGNSNNGYNNNGYENNNNSNSSNNSNNGYENNNNNNNNDDGYNNNNNGDNNNGYDNNNNNNNNDGVPPSSCCEPLKRVIKTNPQCLCTMISNQANLLAGVAGINATEAQNLPAKCGQTVNPIACIVGSDPGNTNRRSSSNAAAMKLSTVDTYVIQAIALAWTAHFLWAPNIISA